MSDTSTVFQRVLVTGGAGFMGSNMVKFLLNKYPGLELTNVDLLTYAGNLDNVRELVGDRRYRFERADIADAAAMDRIFRARRPQLVLNYAAETHVDRSIADPGAFVRTDVIGTYTLLEAVRRHNVKRFVQISTDEVYGPIDAGAATEESPFRPSSPYAASKAGGDHIVQAYWRTYQAPVIVTHGCNFYGPYQYPEKLIALSITNLLEGKAVPVYGDGQQVREWIYVADHCLAIDLIAHQGRLGEAYNVGTGERVTNLELIQKLLALLGADERMVGHIADRPGHDRRYAIDASKLQRELGWRPTRTLDQGLPAAVRWYRENAWWWQKIKRGDYLTYYRRQYGRG